MCFSTSISALLEEYLMRDSQDMSREINQNGKLLEPIIVSDIKFLKELERASISQKSND